MNHEAILKLIEDGEAILEANPPGNNPEAIRQLQTIADSLLAASNNNGVIDQKCGGMMEAAEIAYAPRRRQSYTREHAAYIASTDLGKMRIHIHQLQHAQSPPTTKRRAPGRET